MAVSEYDGTVDIVVCDESATEDNWQEWKCSDDLVGFLVANKGSVIGKHVAVEPMHSDRYPRPKIRREYGSPPT
jgi:hypothetical protein